MASFVGQLFLAAISQKPVLCLPLLLLTFVFHSSTSCFNAPLLQFLFLLGKFWAIRLEKDVSGALPHQVRPRLTQR